MGRQPGYAGEILRIDLSSRSTSRVLTADYADRFIGGRGIAAKIYWDELSPEVKAFDPENRLIFITGPLAGFPGIAGSRWQICGKSPVTVPESFSYASLGGSWGAWLKFAGYDGIIINGKSEKPVYIFIQDGTAEIRDASFLWGKGTVEVRELLKGALGKDVRVAAIGPAGDNMAIMANVFADDDAAGASGFGAVMGSKKLKAIAVRGSGRVAAANPAELEELRKYILDLTRDSLMSYSGHAGSPQEAGKGPKFKKTACYGCIRGCMRVTYEAANGKKGKFMCQPMALYAGHSLKYYGDGGDVPFLAARLCDEYGLDSIAISEIILWLKRCLRAGVLSDESTGLPLSKIGSVEFIEDLIRKISYREGFGELLARGVFEAAESTGTKEHVGDGVHRTGVSYLYGPRHYITTGLLYMTEPRVPISVLHEISIPMLAWLDGYANPEGGYVSTEVFRSIAKRFFGNETAVDFSTYEGKAPVAKIIQDREYAKESLILCDCAWPITMAKNAPNHVGDPTVESKIFSSITGREMEEEGFYQLGERVFNLQRAILVMERRKGREGDALPESDYAIPIKRSLPHRELLMPGKGGEVISREGEVVDKERFERMKDEYYQLRGWDISSGLQTKARLKALGLDDVAKQLEARRLIAAP